MVYVQVRGRNEADPRYLQYPPRDLASPNTALFPVPGYQTRVSSACAVLTLTAGLRLWGSCRPWSSGYSLRLRGGWSLSPENLSEVVISPHLDLLPDGSSGLLQPSMFPGVCYPRVTSADPPPSPARHGNPDSSSITFKKEYVP